MKQWPEILLFYIYPGICKPSYNVLPKIDWHLANFQFIYPFYWCNFGNIYGGTQVWLLKVVAILCFTWNPLFKWFYFRVSRLSGKNFPKNVHCWNLFVFMLYGLVILIYNHRKLHPFPLSQICKIWIISYHFGDFIYFIIN